MFIYFFQIPPVISSKSHQISKNHRLFRFTNYYPKKGIKNDQKAMVRVLVLMF